MDISDLIEAEKGRNQDFWRVRAYIQRYVPMAVKLHTECTYKSPIAIITFVIVFAYSTHAPVLYSAYIQ